MATFEQNIQSWVTLDNQHKLLNDKTKEIRERKSALLENINTYVSKNDLSASTIQISDGKLKFANTKVTEPLTFRYVEKCLKEVIKNESQVKIIIDYLKENRESKMVSEIKRFSNN